MPELKQKAKYQEDKNFKPNPYDYRRVLDTTGTGGPSTVAEVSDAFPVLAASARETAARALDPKDDSVAADLVVLPEDEKEAEEARKRLVAETSKEETVEVGGPSPGQEAAAEGTGKASSASASSKTTVKKTTAKKTTRRRS